MESVPALSVSLETLRQVAQGLNRHELLKCRWGRRVADRHRKPRRRGPQSTRPLERAEIDHFLADVHLCCEHTGKILGRPWITLVVDHYSRMVLGYHITFAPPSAESVLAALRHAILPKDDD